MHNVGFVGDGLTLAWFGPFGKCFGEEGEHFFHALTLEESVGGEIACHGDWGGIGVGIGAEDGDAEDFHFFLSCYF